VRFRYLLGLGSLLVAVNACGSESTPSAVDETAATSTATSAPAGASDAEPEDEVNRVVVVRNLVTEQEADEALALLAENGFEGSTKQSSAELADVSADGWDVVIKGLTSQEATDILIRIASDPDVPYSGVIFIDD
jgi:hypothetical protein